VNEEFRAAPARAGQCPAKKRSRPLSLSQVRKLVVELPSGQRRRAAFFRGLAPNEQAYVLLELGPRLRRELVAMLRPADLEQLLVYLDPDDAAAIASTLSKSEQSRVLRALSERARSKVEYLLKFEPGTAGGIMSLDYVAVERDATLRSAAAAIKKHEESTGKFPTILVVDDGYLLGELPGHIFALAPHHDRTGKHVCRVAHVLYDAPEREVVQAFRDHKHGKVIVLDDEEAIVGVIYADDALKRFHGHAASSLYRYAGLHDEEDVLDSPLHKVGHRYRWLLFNLLTLFIVAGVIALFKETIASFVLLAVYIPVVDGMTDTAGVQTFAVVIRGLALREVTPRMVRKLVLNEMLAGLVNGVIVGVVVGFIAFLFHQSPLFGLVLAISMVFNLLLAGLLGATIPLIMARLGKDPATSATIFINTCNNILGFIVFLGLATIIL